jgi:hypothetical protein
VAENSSDKPLVVVPDHLPVQEDAHEYEVERHTHIGFLKLNQEECDTLLEPIPLEDLDILPSGEVYASQIQYRRRLNKVFGPGGWKMEERSEPKLQDNTVIQKWALICWGVSISTCYGEQDYFPGNKRQTWATAIESAKSNALTRNCKDLGIASECWDRRFTEGFKHQFCIEVRTQSGRAWRRKDRDRLWNEIRQEPPVEAPQPYQAAEKGGAGQAGSATQLPPRSRLKSGQQPAPPTPDSSPRPTQPPQAQAMPTIGQGTDEHRALIQAISAAEEDARAICEWGKVDDITKLRKDQFEVVMKILKSKIDQKRGQLKLD